MKKFWLLIFFIALLTAGTCSANESSSRGLFVSVVQEPTILSSSKLMDQMISLAGEMGVSTIYLQVYRANQSWFPSETADDAPYKKCLAAVGSDPIQLFLDKAHAAGLEVNAWINLLSLAQNADAPLLKKYGTSVLTKDRSKKTNLKDYLIDKQFFLDPGDLRVRLSLVAILKEVVSGYPAFDGILFDYIRYPDQNPDYGYALMSVERYKRARGVKTIDAQSEGWKTWKRNQVTELVSALSNKARTIRPGFPVTVAACQPLYRATDKAFQDWPGWVNSGLIDSAIIMNYVDATAEFEKNIQDARGVVTDFHRIKVGIGAYKLLESPVKFSKQLAACDQSGAGGCIIFDYNTLLAAPSLADRIHPIQDVMILSTENEKKL